MRLIPISLLILFSIALFTSCTDEKKKRGLSEKFSAYSNQNQAVIFSGKVYLNTILENADYQHIPKINTLISSELKAFNQSIYIDSGIYFSVEGLLNKTGIPSVFNVFARIKNKESMQKKIASLGLLLEHTNNLDYAIGPNYSIGIQDDILIIHYQDQGEISADHFQKLFKQLNKDEGTRIELLKHDNKQAIQWTTHLEHIYQLYAKNFNIHLDDLKQKEIESLLKEAKLSSTLTFESGGISINTKHHFSTALKNRLFFEKSTANSLSTLSPGKATLGMSMQFNPLKIQTLVEDFIPDFFDRLGEIHGNIALGMMALGNRPVTNLFGGRLALVYFGESDSHSFHVTLGDAGKSISNLTQSFFSANPLYHLKINEKEIVAIGKNHVSKHEGLVIPSFAKDFGTHGIDFFMDVHDYNAKQPIMEETYPFLEAISWIKISVSNDGSMIRIQGKDAKIGILKQISNVYLNKIRDAVSLY